MSTMIEKDSTETLREHIELSAKIERFDSFWEGPENVDKGYRALGQFYRVNYLKHVPANRDARLLIISCGPGYFVNLLNQEGYTNVLGIDSHAHVGALDAEGRTIAVLGNGLANTYPPESTDLRSRIVERGAVISELRMQAPELPGQFPVRNRIIAGLSLGTLVVEAGFKSGALITADFATDYNREVFAIPGRLDSGTSFGANTLIRDSKAKLVTRLEDILVELGEAGAALTRERDPEKPVLDDVEQRIYDALKSTELNADEIIAETELTPAQVGGALTMLQLKGAIRQLPGNRYARSRANPG